MLTSKLPNPKFGPMPKTIIKLMLLSVLLVGGLQSCYTVVHPPETLPETVTQTISQPVYGSSMGAAGVYGWDPYWEPRLPYTSYHRSYGASYYNPYNYYDYHHSYYAPVYGGSYEEVEPVAGRTFDRNQEMGGSRDREARTGTTGSKGGFGDQTAPTGISTANPVQPAPVVQPRPPVKQVHPKTVEGSKRTRDVKPSLNGKVRSVKQTKNSTQSQKTTPSDSKTSESKKKRVRTRK